jgi:hypothetical protein
MESCRQYNLKYIHPKRQLRTCLFSVTRNLTNIPKYITLPNIMMCINPIPKPSADLSNFNNPPLPACITTINHSPHHAAPATHETHPVGLTVPFSHLFLSAEATTRFSINVFIIVGIFHFRTVGIRTAVRKATAAPITNVPITNGCGETWAQTASATSRDGVQNPTCGEWGSGN